MSDQKRGKSHLRGLSSLLKNTFRVHELVARAMRGECVRQMAKLKSTMSYFPQPHTTTRANISHEEAEQIRARKPARPLKVHGGRESNMCADRIKSSFLFWLLTTLGFYLVGVGAYDDPRRDIKKLFLSYFSVTKSTKSQKEESIDSRLGDADTHAPHMCQSLF